MWQKQEKKLTSCVMLRVYFIHFSVPLQGLPEDSVKVLEEPDGPILGIQLLLWGSSQGGVTVKAKCTLPSPSTYSMSIHTNNVETTDDKMRCCHWYSIVKVDWDGNVALTYWFLSSVCIYVYIFLKMLVDECCAPGVVICKYRALKDLISLLYPCVSLKVQGSIELRAAKSVTL